MVELNFPADMREWFVLNGYSMYHKLITFHSESYFIIFHDMFSPLALSISGHVTPRQTRPQYATDV
jgi:hypothetical protein